MGGAGQEEEDEGDLLFDKKKQSRAVWAPDQSLQERRTLKEPIIADIDALRYLARRRRRRRRMPCF